MRNRATVRDLWIGHGPDEEVRACALCGGTIRPGENHTANVHDARAHEWCVQVYFGLQDELVYVGAAA